MKTHLLYFGVMTVIWAVVLLLLQPRRVKVFDPKTSTFVLSYPLVALYAVFLASLITIVHVIRLNFLKQ